MLSASRRRWYVFDVRDAESRVRENEGIFFCLGALGSKQFLGSDAGQRCCCLGWKRDVGFLRGFDEHWSVEFMCGRGMDAELNNSLLFHFCELLCWLITIPTVPNQG